MYFVHTSKNEKAFKKSRKKRMQALPEYVKKKL